MVSWVGSHAGIWDVSDWEKELDRLLIAGSQEFDETKRKAIYAQFQQIVQEELPIIPLVNKLSFEAVRDRVQNIKYSAIGGAFWNIYELNVSDYSRTDRRSHRQMS